MYLKKAALMSYITRQYVGIWFVFTMIEACLFFINSVFQRKPSVVLYMAILFTTMNQFVVPMAYSPEFSFFYRLDH